MGHSITTNTERMTFHGIDPVLQRGDAYSNERQDCTVHATAIAAQIPYYQAHDLLARFGRRPRHGIPYISFVRNLREPVGAYRIERVRMPETVTLAKFLRDFPKGRFVVRKSGHVFAVIDGIQYDSLPNGPKVRITHIYHFVKD